MYTKCGSMQEAWKVFNKMPSRDVVTWTAMLNGFSVHGHGGEAIAHFEQMCEECIVINNITFVCLLSACSHAGLVYEGLCYFDSMNLVYRICPTIEHYTCMVDILGRAGHLHEAEVMIMTGEPSIAVWMALLGNAEFMVKQRWENASQNELSKLTLEILQAMCCYQISMQQLASWSSEKMSNGRERNWV
jgi:pentatricopeptide repeat protein